MSVEKKSRHSFFFVGLAPHPTQNFFAKKFRDFKKSYKNYGGNLLSYYQNHYQNKRDNPGDFFPMPKAVFRLGLDYGEIALLAFLMYCEDRKTYQCHPSYATIGEAIGMSNNTVKKYVDSLEKKGFIYTEPTIVRTRDGRAHNGSLQYTLQPIKPLEEAYFEKQLREAEARMRYQNAMKKFENKGGKLDEAVNV